MSDRNWRLKYALEWILALAGLAAVLPLLALLMAAVKLTSPGAVFYATRRLGRGGREFTLYKLRSMRTGVPPILGTDGKLLTLRTDSRLTPIGRFLRLGFDELPQLVNVIRGDMCLVGPRPDVPGERGRYSARERGRLRVLPGITGLAAVAGGRYLSNAWNYEMDVLYAERATWRTDLLILLLTVPYAFGLESAGEYVFRDFHQAVRQRKPATGGNVKESAV